MSSLESPESPKFKGGRKRKSPSEESPEGKSSSNKDQPPKKNAHKLIEKRYRNRLNENIAALRDSVPSLRVMSRTAKEGQDEDEDEDLGGLTPAHKLNKATVLSKATEYILHLERRNKRLLDEMRTLKLRVDSYERLHMAGLMPKIAAIVPPEVSMAEKSSTANVLHYHGSVMQGPPKGMIPVPENVRRLHQYQLNQTHYAHPPTAYPVHATPDGRPVAPVRKNTVNGRSANGLMGKLMVGSLAGLMLVEGYREQEKSTDQPSGRGLFALPLDILSRFSEILVSELLEHQGLPLLKITLVFAALFYLVMPLFEAKPKCMKDGLSTLVRLSAAPSPAAPIEVRRKAWLTAIQTVWVPRHNFLLEVAALLLKTCKLSARKLIGWPGYAFLTGTTKEQEAARVKAWEIALDAQLAGGDAEISKSRLVLTLLASGTLPATPGRLLLKALHIRVLLWEVANSGYGEWFMFDELTAKLARRYWNAARMEQKLMRTNGASPTEDSKELPDHLAALLDMECEDVLIDSIVQRAYNLAWNRPQPAGTQPNEAMDAVTEDTAIRSPLDALAAWWSSVTLNDVLLQYLDSYSTTSTTTLSNDLEQDLNLAITTAPPGSGPHQRALAAKAIFASTDRESHVATAYAALPTASSPLLLPSPLRDGTVVSSPRTTLMNFVSDTPAPQDVRVALTLAKCLSLAELSSATTDPTPANRAATLLNTIHLPAASFTLLSFVAALRTLQVFSRDRKLRGQTRRGLEHVATSMRLWIGREVGGRSGFSSEARGRIVEVCLRVVLGREGFGGEDEDDEEEDAGYVSQIDEGGGRGGK